MVSILADESADRVWQGLVGALSEPDTLWTVERVGGDDQAVLLQGRAQQ